MIESEGVVQAKYRAFYQRSLAERVSDKTIDSTFRDYLPAKYRKHSTTSPTSLRACRIGFPPCFASIHANFSFCSSILCAIVLSISLRFVACPHPRAFCADVMAVCMCVSFAMWMYVSGVVWFSGEKRGRWVCDSVKVLFM